MSWRLGAITIDRVMELERPLFDPAALLPSAKPELIDRHRSWLEPRLLDPSTGQLILAFHSFVVRTPSCTIVVDTCSGNDKPRPKKLRYHEKQWPYLERLAAVGVVPEAVDVVVCTHLHLDHVGWNTRLVAGRWVPTFPHASYRFARREWEFWREEYRSPRFTDDPFYEDSLFPVLDAGLVSLVEDDHVIDDGVTLELTPGHTPGHVSVHVAGGGREAVMSGDLMHHAVQCAEPDWSSVFCVDAEASRRMRRAFLERYADTDALIMPAHFPSPSAGRIVRAGGAFRFAFDGEP